MQQEKHNPQTIGVIGLGLIGGSMARALKKYTDCRVLGVDTDSAALSAALDAGAIDGAADTDEALGCCDLLLLALYPQRAVAFILERLGGIRPGAAVVDFCGVKQYLAKQLAGPCAARGIFYVGGHPMAGKEQWGFSGSDADLFLRASMLLAPLPDTPPALIGALRELFDQIGFGRVLLTTTQAHDKMIAFTSQLAHVVSSAYVKSPQAQEHHGFSAGSYRDLTRVARLNPEMWTELFLENAEPLIDEIDQLIVHLDEYRQAIAEQDAEKLYALLEDGKKIKEALDYENH